MDISLKNDLGELARLVDEIEFFASENHLESQLVFRLNLALEELVTNIISYGYEGYPRDTTIDITLTLKEDSLEVKVKDYAAPFNPLAVPEPDVSQDVEDRKIGGLGIHLVRKMMDSLNYSREEGANVLTMVKYLEKNS